MQMGVVNRDIKLENSLLDGSKKPLLKLCDFGYSKSNVDSVPKSNVGTPGYAGEAVDASRPGPWAPLCCLSQDCEAARGIDAGSYCCWHDIMYQTRYWKLFQGSGQPKSAERERGGCWSGRGWEPKTCVHQDVAQGTRNGPQVVKVLHVPSLHFTPAPASRSHGSAVCPITCHWKQGMLKARAWHLNIDSTCSPAAPRRCSRHEAPGSCLQATP